MKDDKTAVVLFNLGGPLKEEDIKPFLFNFFMDKNIINLPKILRYFLAKYISINRSKKLSKKSYKYLDYKSPLLENTLNQKKALENILNRQKINNKVFVSMRYWHPMAEETVKEVINYSPDKIILIPLYPQFSTTTTGSSLEDWYRIAKKYNLEVPTKDICCYPNNDGFILSSVENIKHEIEKAPKEFRLIFSAHGLPKYIIENGDPYQYQCEKTVNSILKKLDIENIDWVIAYQSKVGKLKWLTPSLDDEILRAGKDKIALVVYPIAFVSEHVETLVELDIEYKELAVKNNVPYFGRAKTVGTSRGFIKGLANIIISLLDNKKSDKLCDNNFNKCYKRRIKR